MKTLLRRLTIRQRLSACVAFIAILTLGLGGWSQLSHRSSLAALEHVLDEQQQTVMKLRGTPFKSYAERFLPPLIFAKQYLANAARNMRLFLANDFHMESGKKELIAAFYRSIVEGTPVPIPYRQILLTSRLMDSIFEQVAKSPSLANAKEGVPC